MNDNSSKGRTLYLWGGAAVMAIAGLVYLGVRTNEANPDASVVQGSAQAPAGRWYPTGVLETGRTLYLDNCQSCHGEQGEGAPEWRERGPDGKWPPPPLNGTGHAWHHPLPVLYQVIMEGSPAGSGNMPAWRGRLSREEVLAIIAWFQSQWPDELYAAWARRDAQYRSERQDSG